MGRLEAQKVGRTEGRWADLLVDLLVDRLGALKVARTAVQMADRSVGRRAVQTADRLVAQKVARTAGRLGGQNEEQMEGWPEGLAPRRQERVLAVLRVRPWAPLASA